MKIPFFRQIAMYLVVAMFIIGVAPRVEAGFSPSSVVNAKFDRAGDIGKIQQVIETKIIKERLEKLGYTTDEVKSRLDRLSDNQIHQLALNLDNIKVGRDDGLGILIALLIIAILVVIILQVTGHKVIVQ